MNPSERAEELRSLLQYHNDKYYNQDSPELSDADYDALLRELRELETQHPDLFSPDSPTQQVGGSAKRRVGVLIAHRHPMLSMQDVFDREAVEDFVSTCLEKLGTEISFLVETKIDGLSLALRYEHGALVTALTRGDGHSFGEDVTLNAKVIADIPHQLHDAPEYLEVRGEVYMTNASFKEVNEQQELLEKRPFANPRNCAAGTLRQLDSKVTKERKLSFFVFNIQDLQGHSVETHAEAYRYLRSLGMTVIEQHLVCHSAAEVWQAIEQIGELRGNLPYEIDGAVVKVNELQARAQLRDTTKNAGYQIAYKYPPERKETKLLDIELSVGRTGKITPTAILEPIRLCGTTVARATLHNQDFIEKFHICLGSTLLIEKSGEVIPKCVGEIEALRPPNAVLFQIPDLCPVCGSAAKREADSADIRCTNLACPAQIERLIRHFVSRDAMDIKGFGDVYIHDLIEAGYLHDSADIFTLKEQRDALIEGGLIGKEKNTDKLLAVIEKAKKNPPHRLLTGLGIPNVGKAAAKQLMNTFGSLDELTVATEEQLLAVDDVGPATARCLLDYFETDGFRCILQKLQNAAVNLQQEKKQSTKELLPLSGKSFVITGSLPDISREEAAARIETQGGQVKTSVSKKTHYLLAGEDAGSKLTKAQNLGVPILDWAGFLSLLME